MRATLTSPHLVWSGSDSITSLWESIESITCVLHELYTCLALGYWFVRHSYKDVKKFWKLLYVGPVDCEKHDVTHRLVSDYRVWATFVATFGNRKLPFARSYFAVKLHADYRQISVYDRDDLCHRFLFCGLCDSLSDTCRNTNWPTRTNRCETVSPNSTSLRSRTISMHRENAIPFLMLSVALAAMRIRTRCSARQSDVGRKGTSFSSRQWSQQRCAAAAVLTWCEFQPLRSCFSRCCRDSTVDGATPVMET